MHFIWLDKSQRSEGDFFGWTYMNSIVSHQAAALVHWFMFKGNINKKYYSTKR